MALTVAIRNSILTLSPLSSSTSLVVNAPTRIELDLNDTDTDLMLVGAGGLTFTPDP